MIFVIPDREMYASDPARTPFETWVTMECADSPGVICAAGGATMIWVDFPAQQAKPLPDRICQRFKSQAWERLRIRRGYLCTPR